MHRLLQFILLLKIHNALFYCHLRPNILFMCKLMPLSSARFEKLILAQLVKKFLVSYGIRKICYRLHNSLPLEPAEFSSYPIQDQFKCYPRIRLGLPNDFFSSSSQTKIFCAFLISRMRAACLCVCVHARARA
jgi:hypothetical protein